MIRRGENQRKGDLLLSRRVLRPQDLGILASSGYASVPVVKPPVVGVLATGNEIVPAGGDLMSASVYDSNGPQLLAQAAAMGGRPVSFGIVRDEEKEVRAALEKALGASDILLVSGAVSVGDFDFVPEVLVSLGVERVFHTLKMKPGKPLFFGRLQGKAVFGLPGNPVSSFVGFEIFVRPYLEARLGLPRKRNELTARLASAVKRGESGRVEFLPAKLDAGAAAGPRVRPLPYRGSSMLAALAEADCLLRLEIGENEVAEGRWVRVRLLGP